MIVAHVKRKWHRDLVARPRLHAWVFNLYRAGELYPRSVDDYFPVAIAPWPWLADAMRSHERDENRHGRIFETLIGDCGGEVRDDLAGSDVYNSVIRRHTPTGFAVDAGASPDARRDALAHFLAHSHYLELRVLGSLEMHVEACEDAGQSRTASLIATILRDEARHAAYTREAIDELVPKGRARDVLSVHRRAERRANLEFSCIQVRRCLERHRDLLPSEHRLLFRIGASIQEAASRV